MAACLNKDRIKNPMGGEANDPRVWKGKSGYVLLLVRSHQGRAVAGDTVTIISHGLEIAIAESGVDEKDEEKRGFFLFLFLYHIFVVKVQEMVWSASYGENKIQNPKHTNK